MIVTLLAAALLLSPQTEDDIHCLAYLSVAAGKVDGETRRKVEGGALYYFGRIEASDPQLDIAAALQAIVSTPEYDKKAYEADKARCHAQLDPLAAHFDAWKGRYEGAR